MVMVHGGNLIKHHREKRKITIAQLCEGICSTSTLQRIENNKQTPSVFVFMRLIERLGFDASKFFTGVFDEKELEFFNAYYEIEALLMSKKIDEAELKIKILRHLGQNFDKGDGAKIREQKLLVLELAIERQKEVDVAQYSDKILQALRLTFPKFDESKIATYMLSFDEISLLNMLAMSYEVAGNPEKEIEILKSVKASMDKHYADEYEKSRGYTLTLSNLSTALGIAGRHAEVIEICDIAIKHCVAHKRLFVLPKLKFNKGCAMFYLGKKDGYKRLIIEAVYALRNNEDFVSAESSKAFAEDELGIIFPKF